MAHGTRKPQWMSYGLALALCVLGAKTYVVVLNGQFVPHAPWQRAFWWGQDVALAAVLVSCVWLAFRFGGRLVRTIAYAACAAVALVDTILYLAAGVLRTYVTPTDPLPMFAGQLGAVIADYGTPGSVALLIGTVAGLAAGPALARRPASAVASALDGRRWAKASVGAALAAYIGATLLAFSAPVMTALPMNANPILYFLREGVSPSTMFDEAAQPASAAEMSARVHPAAAEAGFSETSAGIDELRGVEASVVLVVLESIGAKALELGGADPSTHPFLSKNKDRIVTFRRYHSTAPHTTAAMESIHCGDYRLPKWPKERLLDGCRTLPRRLGEQGVRTGFFQSTYFDDWIPRSFFDKLGYDDTLDANAIKAQRAAQGRTVEMADGILQEHETVSALLDWIGRRCDAKTPFLATYASWVAHSPYPGSHAGGFPYDEGASAKARHRSLVRVLDAQIERIDAFLAGRECGRPVVVLVVGDHGEAFFEHMGNRYHAAYPYEENLWVPLYVIAPGLKGRSVDRVASHVDLAPTIADLLLGETRADAVTGPDTSSSDPGRPVPGFEGRSLLRPGAPRVSFGVSLLGEGMATARYGQFKLIRSSGMSVLFDTDADPGERDDLSGDRADLKAALELSLDQWAAALARRYP